MGDRRLPEPGGSIRLGRCKIYRELADWSSVFTRADYPEAGEGCADRPFDDHPWLDGAMRPPTASA